MAEKELGTGIVDLDLILKLASIEPWPFVKEVLQASGAEGPEPSNI